MMSMEQIRKDLEQKLSHERFEHTISVMYTAAALAMCHNSDVQKALLAGLLHDCTKYMTREEHLEFCAENNIELTAFELQNKHLLHSRSGAAAAEIVYGVEDQEVLQSIASHTTGRANMSLLEKIVFVADYIEPGRRGLKGMNKVRHLAFHDLDACIHQISENTLGYLRSTGASIDPRTVETNKYYSNTKAHVK